MTPAPVPAPVQASIIETRTNDTGVRQPGEGIKPGKTASAQPGFPSTQPRDIRATPSKDYRLQQDHKSHHASRHVTADGKRLSITATNSQETCVDLQFLGLGSPLSDVGDDHGNSCVAVSSEELSKFIAGALRDHRSIFSADKSPGKNNKDKANKE